MRTIAIAVMAIWASATQAQDRYTNGYDRATGSHVDGYYHTAPNGDPSDNYSSRGNVNPYTGAVGTHRY